ncbi:ABC transporter substrate-binding protein [Corynebacterium variabile]|uniref:ABC transporter substrate-binding protein n=1 Tax=Corynebacterium variabile TaxID=1727 RepID=UPI003F8EDD74
MVSLGEVPVIMWENMLKQEVWTVDAFDGQEPENTSASAEDGSIDLESVAAAEPDLILASQMDLGDQYDDLSKTALVTGDTAQVAADVKAEHPEFEGKSISMLNYFGLDTIRYLDPDDSDAADLMESIGLTTIAESSSFGSDDISAERLDDTAADVMVIMDNSNGRIDDLTDNPTFQAIPGVKEGRVLILHNKAFESGKAGYTVNDDAEEQEGNLPWAIVYPGPLSTQWALETLAPLLADAIGGDEG